jgi:hypothetical protein
VAVLGRRLDGSILTVTETRHSVGNQLEFVNDRKQNNVPMSVIIAFFTLFKNKQNNKVISFEIVKKFQNEVIIGFCATYNMYYIFVNFFLSLNDS